MFSFFKKKSAGTPDQLKEITCDYSSLMVDMHSHVLPGIDDGAQNPEESIVLIKKMMELGIKKIIATPHVMVDYYRNTPESIGNALQILKEELQKQEIDIKVEAAAEHYFDETFGDRVNNGKLMTMGDKYVLFELSFMTRPPDLIDMIKRMTSLGYKPILAHPERYNYLTINDLAIIKGWGCNLQLNTISLLGYYGKETKKIAEEIAEKQMVDFISSDMHNPRHANAFHDALRMPIVEQLMESKLLKNRLLF